MTTKVEGFDRLVEPFRAELLAYCYRMLGSAHDAEDLVQDTYLRAWRAREQYDETRSSLRTWLYRIATNVCLTALEVRGRRPLPSGLVAASDPLGPLVRGENVAWLQPLPDSLLDAGDPARAVIDRSSLRLAFAAALQHLSARQRGALILRDVLGFSASEAAEILGTTVVSVNSSLQRARTRVKEVGVRQERLSEPSAAEQRAWVDRYMKAFEHADVEGLKRLLTEDVLMEMPPMLNWFAGPGNYGLFMEWVFEAGRNGLASEGGRGQRPARVRRLPARRWRIRAAHAPDLHRHRRGHQPEFGVPGFRGLRVFRSGGRTRRPRTGRRGSCRLAEPQHSLPRAR